MVPFASLSALRHAAGMLPGVVLAAASVAHAGEVPATAIDMDTEQWQTVERLLRYDVIVGKPLAPDIGLCVDSQVDRTKALVTQPVDSATSSSRFEDQVSRAAEACISRAAQEARASRFVGEIVASLMTGRQHRIAQETERARSCLASATDVPTLKGCITKARGQELAESDWKHWVTLYEQYRKP
ncbi:MAG TPA: hypothetical protein VJ654_11010 [Noviherbaspirillum sp.]|nr:hypothetical protein [Noviherbaspirillum sp.]